MVQLLCNGYSVDRGGSIVFVCGGNEPHHMRPTFKEYCKDNCPDINIFFPEFAMRDYFTESAVKGYFSAVNKLAKKTLLVLNSEYQASDSFISMGPVRAFNQKSDFRDAMYISYKTPHFADVVTRPC